MKILQLLLSVVLVYALAIVICCATEKESGLRGQIVFQSDRDENVEVFRINTDLLIVYRKGAQFPPQQYPVIVLQSWLNSSDLVSCNTGISL